MSFPASTTGNIILDDEAKEFFLKVVRAYEDLLGIEVLTHCVMSSSISQLNYEENQLTSDHFRDIHIYACCPFISF